MTVVHDNGVTALKVEHQSEVFQLNLKVHRGLDRSHCSKIPSRITREYSGRQG